jgi:hypothetical protein
MSDTNFKDYCVEQERDRNETPLESALSRGHRRYPKEMTVNQMIWKLIKLRLKYGNLPIKTWVQSQRFCDMYEPQYERYIKNTEKFISIY